jgi:hypothetical protein
LLGHAGVLLQALVDVLFAVIALSADELLAELEQALLGLLELSLLPLI